MSKPNNQPTAWITPLAIAIVCCLAMPSLFAYPAVFSLVVVVAGLSTAVAIWVGVHDRVRLRDRYDLGTLREIHEREELSELDPGTVDPEADKVVCLHCNHQYHSRFPACPNCGHK